MSSDKPEKAIESTEKSQAPSIEYLVETVKQLQIETERLRQQTRKSRGPISGRISFIFLAIGALSLLSSIFGNSQVLAFIGLSLTFWGALFLFARPVKYVKSELLDSTAVSSYATVDRIVKDLKYKGKSYYIPPFPKEVYLPDHLKGLKEMVVFISADSGSQMPTVEEMASSKFLINRDGICIAPPGLGFAAQIEKELRRDLSKTQLNELLETLPQTILDNFQLAERIELEMEDKRVCLRIFNSLYHGLYKQNLKSIHSLGCPLVSSISCILAKTTGRITTIDKDGTSSDGQTLTVWLSFMEGKE